MSARLDETLRTLRARGEGAFMPFLVIGDPDLPTCHRLVDALVEAGSDVLEFGLPFSDPPADGPVIQKADVRALAAGVTTADALRFLAEVKQRHDRPMALLMYFNLMLQHGVQRFFEDAAAAGVDAILVADVPVDESDEIVIAARRTGVAPIFIGGTFSTAERLGAVSERGRGYLYVVARTGITGEQGAVESSLPGTLQRLRESVDLPLLVGFGISTPDQVREVLAAGADGAIVGSAIVRRIEAALGDPDRMVAEVRDFARELKAATRPASRPSPLPPHPARQPAPDPSGAIALKEKPSC